MAMRVRGAAILGLWVLCVLGSAQAPIEVRNGRALSLPFLRLRPVIEGAARPEIEASYLAANSFRRMGSATDPVLEEDYEVHRFEFAFRKAWGGGWSGEVHIPYQSIGSGFLDPIIDGWHQGVLGWSQPGRNATGFGRTTVRSPGNPDFGSASGLGDGWVQATRPVGKGVLSLAAKAPTGDADELLGSGAFDFGFGLGGALWKRGRWALSGFVGGVWQGNPKRLSRARSFVDQEVLTLSYHSCRHSEWILQWQSEASALRSGIPASDAAHRLMVFGYRQNVDERNAFEVFFTEDEDLVERQIPEIASIGPDFAIGLRWIWRR